MTEGWRTRTLVRTDLITVGECHCIPGSSTGASQYLTTDFECVFPRRGLFAKDSGPHSALADTNWTIVFTPGEVIQTRRMLDIGFDCRWVRIAPAFLDGLNQGMERTPLMATPAPVLCPARRYLTQRLFAAGGVDDPVRIEEKAVELVQSVVQGALTSPVPFRESTALCHAGTADAAKRFIATRFRERLTLSQIARAVHASPFHLCRIFRAQTGMTIHRYLISTRLRAALEEILDSGSQPDLSSLALGLGFCSHSHFTSAFRREFEITPSGLRASAQVRCILAAQQRHDIAVGLKRFGDQSSAVHSGTDSVI